MITDIKGKNQFFKSINRFVNLIESEKSIFRLNRLKIAITTKYRVIGSIFHKQIVKSEEYQRIATALIALCNNAREGQKGWFQQDNAKAHISVLSMTFIHKFFKERVISVSLCPPRSLDLSPAVLFL